MTGACPPPPAAWTPTLGSSKRRRGAPRHCPSPRSARSCAGDQAPPTAGSTEAQTPGRCSE
eukprot:7896223-Pyramimonas_sp.AAC.1